MAHLNQHAEAGFILHVRRDDQHEQVIDFLCVVCVPLLTRHLIQLAVIFSAPPHDVLASKFSLDLVMSDSLENRGSLGGAWSLAQTGRELIPSVPNRVHFFSMKTPKASRATDAMREVGHGDYLAPDSNVRCAKGVCWVQLIVHRWKV